MDCLKGVVSFIISKLANQEFHKQIVLDLFGKLDADNSEQILNSLFVKLASRKMGQGICELQAASCELERK